MGKPLNLFIFIALVLLTLWAYRPGLSGGFLFDDFTNLPALGSYGPVDNTTTLLRYLTSGTADPTGRPLALASFLLDANDWPADPYPFKRTNLLIHLLNGFLLAWLLLRLGRERGLSSPHAGRAATLGAGVWMLHPLLVSTTLYIVQREAMLPATFTLAGLIGYVQGRRLVLDGRIKSGHLLSAIALVGGTLLSILSKANGALLPLLAGVVEITVLAGTNANLPSSFRRLKLLLMGLPCLALFGYLYWQLPESLSTYPAFRPWTYGQRLLTEPRILWDYLGLLWLPRPYSTGLFNDHILASQSLINPWSTLPALLGILLLGIVSLFWRKKLPILAAAILFFLAGHLLESTVIALELYFEHRNYLPALLLFWPFACWITQPGDHWRKGRLMLGVSVIVLLAGMTHLRASLWGNPQEQALLWAVLNPTSPRAAANAAQFEISHDRPAAAEARLRKALALHPHEVQITLNLLSARCAQGSVEPADLLLAANSLEHTREGTGLMFKWLTGYIPVAVDNSCSGISYESLDYLIEAAEKNPRISRTAGYRQDLSHLKGLLDLRRQATPSAIAHFDAAFAEDPKPGFALKQAAILASAGYPCAGLRQLDLLEAEPRVYGSASQGMARLHQQLLEQQGYWQQEIAYLRAVMERDRKEAGDHPCRPGNLPPTSPPKAP
jgi:tetratricopeptide (TPR) repeat protein